LGNFLRAVSVSLSDGNAWQELSFDFEAEIEGTLQIFVGSESDVSVWYDDLRITWEQALIVQENHYYPFGMNLVGIEKQGQPHDRFQYNGKEKQEEFGLNAYDYGARLYSFDAPRWWQIDPLAEKYYAYSAYNYVLNNPINAIDPDGQKVEHIKGGIRITGEEDIAAFFRQTQAQVGGQESENQGQEQEGQEDCCPWLREFFNGLTNAVVHNATKAPIGEGEGIVELQRPSTWAEYEGQEAGHKISLLLAALEIVSGLTVTGGSLVLEGGTLGLASPIALPAAAGGAFLTGHGFVSAKNALDNKGRVYAHDKKKQSTGSFSGAKKTKHQKGEKRDRMVVLDKKRNSDNWVQNPNKKRKK
jgi:RHS repeat-associated protein